MDNSFNSIDELKNKTYHHFRDGTLSLFELEVKNQSEEYKREFYKLVALLNDFVEYYTQRVEEYRSRYINSGEDKKELSLYIDDYCLDELSGNIKNCVFNGTSTDQSLKDMSDKSFKKYVSAYKLMTQEKRKS